MSRSGEVQGTPPGHMLGATSSLGFLVTGEIRCDFSLCSSSKNKVITFATEKQTENHRRSAAAVMEGIESVHRECSPWSWQRPHRDVRDESRFEIPSAFVYKIRPEAVGITAEEIVTSCLFSGGVREQMLRFGGIATRARCLPRKKSNYAWWAV